MADGDDVGEFYLRYYVGHKGKFGHEFLEFEFRPDGKLRYANNSNYKNDTMIRKEIYLTPAVLKECRRIVADSEIMKEDDNNWPEPDRVGRQELEIVMGNEHISFTTSKIGSLMDVQTSKDPEGFVIDQSGSSLNLPTSSDMISALVLFHGLVCSATVYNVGDSSGWDISTNLDSWSRNKAFSVGDTLLFQYSQYHSLSEMTKENYDGCNTSNVLQSSSNGNTTIALTSPGDRCFVCGNRLHCLGGMKLHVNVVSGNLSELPAGAPQASAQPGGALPPASTKANQPINSAVFNYGVGMDSLVLALFGALVVLLRMI